MCECDWMHGWLSVCVDGCVEPLAWLNLPQARFVCSVGVLLFCCCMGEWVGKLVGGWIGG